MSKSPISTRKKVFLTQDESVGLEPMKSKHNLELTNPTQELSNLKKKYDTVKQENIKKTLYLDWLRGKVYDLKSTAVAITSDMKTFQVKSEDYEQEIEKAKQLLNQELELKRVYEHMLSRNKSEGTQLDIKVNKFSENLKSAKLRMDIENEKARKTKDHKFNVKGMMKELRETLEEDTKKHIAHISSLENNIVNRREMIRRYDERTKRQAEIVELAARQDRESHEKSIREEIILNKLLYDVLVLKEKNDKKAGLEIENAFQDIKTKTGFTNPREILGKFMSREDTHNRLIDSVEKAETTLDQMKTQYYEFRDQLKNLLLVTDEGNQSVDATENHDKVTEAYKQLEKIHEQQRKSSTIFRDVVKWSKKISEKLEIKPSDTIESNVQTISKRISELIERCKLNKDEFDENILAYDKKKTRDLVREIYAEVAPRKPSI
ncbi:hypothetical protein SteCoe_19250 [Stentor coeruleus]|uniref:Uncharacterized protein n=1 Tax=Stentor coeruleus TaxID=5963 RepID=A0A1R2BUQ9_9CILI|nr:hypothetical protein SteCoe_19250 [Stentor coeruleus]